MGTNSKRSAVHFKTPIDGNDLFQYRTYCNLFWDILRDIEVNPETANQKFKHKTGFYSTSWEYAAYQVFKSHSNKEAAACLISQMMILELQYPELEDYKTTMENNFEKELETLQLKQENNNTKQINIKINNIKQELTVLKDTPEDKTKSARMREDLKILELGLSENNKDKNKLKKMHIALSTVYDSEIFAYPAYQVLEEFEKELEVYITSLKTIADGLGSSFEVEKATLNQNIESLKELKDSISYTTDRQESPKNSYKLLFGVREFNRIQINLQTLNLPSKQQEKLQTSTSKFLTTIIDAIKSFFGVANKQQEQQRSSKNFLQYTRSIATFHFKPHKTTVAVGESDDECDSKLPTMISNPSKRK